MLAVSSRKAVVGKMVLAATYGIGNGKFNIGEDYAKSCRNTLRKSSGV